MEKIVWRPHEGPQELFLQSPAYEVFFGGSKGPGKTECLLMEAARQHQKSRYRGAIFRRTFPRLGEIIDRSFKYYPHFGAKYSGRDMQLELPAWTFPSGAKIAFGHVQHERDKYNYQGKEIHYMGFDQLEEFTESQYLFLFGQNRTTDPDIWCYIRSTGNPGGVGHAWVKKRFIEPFQNYPGEIKYFKRVNDEDMEFGADEPDTVSRTFFPATLQDNPSILKNDPGYISRLKQQSEDDQRAFIHGDWDIFKGQFFSMWRNSIHVVNRDIEPSFEKFLSLDYGYGAPSCVLWWMVDYDGRLHAYRELYGEGMNYEKLALIVKEHTPDEEKMNYCVADPAIWNDRSHHKDIEGESGAETMQRIWSGFTSLMQADNSRVTGWGRMRILMSANPPMMTYSSLCKNSIRTIPALIHDDIKVEDVDTEGEDHSGDSSRYATMSRPQYSIKPQPRSVDPAMPMAGELLLKDEKLSPYRKLMR